MGQKVREICYECMRRRQAAWWVVIRWLTLNNSVQQSNRTLLRWWPINFGEMNENAKRQQRAPLGGRGGMIDAGMRATCERDH
jgi:hypothetical protein